MSAKLTITLVIALIFASVAIAQETTSSTETTTAATTTAATTTSASTTASTAISSSTTQSTAASTTTTPTTIDSSQTSTFVSTIATSTIISGETTTTKYPCPAYPVTECPAGYNTKTYTDQNGCSSSSCEQTNTLTTFSSMCGNKICESGENADSCPYDCETRPYCGNNKCDIGEDYKNCGQDCPYEAGPIKCPAFIECRDGSRAECRSSGTGSCNCDQCPFDVPEGCRQERDASGFVNVVCEHACPVLNEDILREKKLRCEQGGGNFIVRKDPRGCEFPNCEYAPPPTSSLEGYERCHTEKELIEAENRCKSFEGSEFFVKVVGECKIGVCEDKRHDICPRMTESQFRDIEYECRTKQLHVIEDYDGKGCKILKCGNPDECPREVPKKAVDMCKESGGEFIVKRDPNGCVRFSECIAQGDERSSYVERPNEVPDSTKLLEMAFKLEKLKIQLIKLSKESEDIANFYASVNSEDEERYRRVSDMFKSAADKVDEIKARMRDNLEGITTDDMMEIRSDIKYIKDVMIKDILYIMLSSSSDVKELTSETKKNCGTDGSCFDRAIRVCKPIIFTPDGREGPTMEITGLEGDFCVMHGKVEGPGGSSYEMTCKIPDYSLGIDGPEDLIPNCEGSMVELMKKFGPGGGDDFPPPEGGPGGCMTPKECAQYCLDNYDDCVEWTKQHPKYGPPPSIEELKRYSEEGFDERRFEGPGGCSNEKECRKYCSRPENFDECRRFGPGPEERNDFPEREFGGEFGQPSGEIKCPDGICDEFEKANPNECPQDCGGIGGGF